MNIVIVEDELPASEQMQQFVRAHNGKHNIIGVYTTCAEILRHLDGNDDVDVVFCDIELRDGNALTALQKIELKTVIVFSTAYDQFWNESLQLNGIDYLLKPITTEKVHAALDKVAMLKKIFTKDSQLLQQLSGLLRQQTTFSYRERFPVRIGNEVFVIDVNETAFFRISSGVIFAMAGDKKKYPLMEETLSALEAQLDPRQFFRVNRSDIVNIRFIRSVRIEEGGDYTVLLKGNDEKLVVSSSRIAQLKEWFK
nr:LytTR family DNA-binding domain-containing protein [uncultured Chitinophaga sp.]